MTALYDGAAVAPEDVLSVYVVLNGTLKMSAGKQAAMAFHCGRRVAEPRWILDRVHESVWAMWQEWWQQGKRVVVRSAETPHVFERVCQELAGFTHHDEGLTEVERGAAVAFVSIPYKRADVPQILRHKRCQLL